MSELDYRLRQQQLTAEFGYFSIKNKNFDVLLQKATEFAAQGLNTNFSKIMQYLPGENKFLICAGVGWGPGIVGEMKLLADLESPTGYAFLTGKPVISNHLAGETRFRTPSVLATHGIKRAINVIIWDEKIPFGVLEVDSQEEGDFNELDIAFLQSFANTLAIALERK